MFVENCRRLEEFGRMLVMWFGLRHGTEGRGGGAGIPGQIAHTSQIRLLPFILHSPVGAGFWFHLRESTDEVGL